MRKNENISLIRKIKIFMLLLLTVVGLISNTDVCVFSELAYPCKQITQEASEDQQEDQQFFTVAYEAIVPAFSVNINAELYAIFEAPLLDVILLVEEPGQIIPAERYFNTLFRFIISTNAP